ncbi:MAG: glycosyltransferase family 4 protein [Bacteroidia bacterium]|nr:glycosyltransferase family 4 protein [Bacteroidia bacterium]
MKAVFLCRRLAGYMFESIQYFSQKYNIQSIVLTTPADPNAPFDIQSTREVSVLSVNSKNEQEWIQYIQAFGPDVIYMAGWAVPLYKKIVKPYVSRIPVVMGMDAQWLGTMKQIAGTFASSFYVKPYCNHVWVAGNRQYEFAKRLGFKNSQILTGFYTATTTMFQSKYKPETPPYSENNLKKLVFIGRFVSVKQPEMLIEAFEALNPEVKKDWELVMIGAGEMKEKLKSVAGKQVRILDFMQPAALTVLLCQSHAFCLPSSYEPWGVVVHESACLGLPMILSDACGAATDFLIHGYNGFMFDHTSKASLVSALSQLFSLDEKALLEMRKNSFHLSSRITLDTWAGTLNSVLTK